MNKNSGVFISYVTENRAVAKEIAEILKSNGIDVWLDRNSLKAGQSWLEEIRCAIKNGTYFIPLFSKEWNQREYSVAHDELLIAIEEVRERPSDQAWIIPLKINRCTIPQVSIGEGRDLSSLHLIDFSSIDKVHGLERLLHAIGVNSPVIANITDSSNGWPAKIQIVRDDKYVNDVAIEYWIDGLPKFVTSDPKLEKTTFRLGEVNISCLAKSFSNPIFRTRGYGQGHYWVGKSDTLKVVVDAGKEYELFVCGDSITRYSVSSPYVEFGRMIGRRLGSRGIDLGDSKTWPRIQLKFLAV